VDILILRATIRQSRHDFHPALADLALALERDPRNAQAWLTKATVEQVLGRPADARRSCQPLFRLADEWIAVTASAAAAGLNGEARESRRQLAALCARTGPVDPELRSWTLTALGEIDERLGDTRAAEARFRAALELTPRDAYLLGAYADLLLDSGRAREVGPLLADHARADALLLRLALAETITTGDGPHRRTMQDRLAASRLRGDTVHQREEARFALRVLNDAPQALRLAAANWEVQREPADARILLEAALGAHQPAAAQPVRDFIRTNHLEDVRLATLTDRP